MDYIEFPYVLVAMGEPLPLFSMRDFEDVLREYIGEDAVQFFRQATEGADAKVKELEDTVEYLEQQVEEDELSLREALR